MFQITPDGANRPTLDLSGSIDREAMSGGLDSLIDASEGFENGRMLHRIRDFRWPALDAGLDRPKRIDPA